MLHFFNFENKEEILSSILVNNIQAYLWDIAGLVPDHCNKASHTNVLVSQCI
jgi:hypothetical protein